MGIDGGHQLKQQYGLSILLGFFTHGGRVAGMNIAHEINIEEGKFLMLSL